MLIFDFVKQRRKELFLTQVELAKKANVSLSVVKRFEAKKPYNPRVDYFLKMARALGVSGHYILFECEWP